MWAVRPRWTISNGLNFSILSCKAFYPSGQAHDCNLWQTGLSTIKFHQLQTQWIPLGVGAFREQREPFLVPDLLLACDLHGWKTKSPNSQEKDTVQTSCWIVKPSTITSRTPLQVSIIHNPIRLLWNETVLILFMFRLFLARGLSM